MVKEKQSGGGGWELFCITAAGEAAAVEGELGVRPHPTVYQPGALLEDMASVPYLELV